MPTLHQVVWNDPGSPYLRERRILKGHFEKVYALSWAGQQVCGRAAATRVAVGGGPAAAYMVSAANDGRVLLWNTHLGTKVASVTLKSNWVMSCDISPAGNMVASGGLDNTVSLHRLVDANGRRISHQKRPVTELKGHEGYISCARFLDTRRILTSSGDTSCCLWDIETGQPSFFPSKGRDGSHSGDVMRFVVIMQMMTDCYSLSLSPERELFVSGGCDGTVKIWDVRSPTCTMSFDISHASDVNAVQYDVCHSMLTWQRYMSNGHCVVSGSDDGCCRLFELRAERSLDTYEATEATGPALSITSVALSRSGRLIFAGNEGRTCVWDVLDTTRISKEARAHHIPLSSLKGHRNKVSCVGVSSDGVGLCTGSWDQTLKLWAK